MKIVNIGAIDMENNENIVSQDNNEIENNKKSNAKEITIVPVLSDKQLEKQKKLKKQKQKDKYKRDKDNYFSYYDDIKVGSHKIVDW